MSEKSRRNDAVARQAGPQGTQVFSRQQLGEMLDQADSTAAEFEGAMLIVEGDSSVQRFPLTSDRITIGRSRVCDLSIDEPSMSSEHARLVHSEGAWRIVNLLSTNGVFINGEKVFSCQLHDGDEIRLGRARLVFRNSGQDGHRANGRARDSSLTMAIWITIAFAGIALVTWLLLR